MGHLYCSVDDGATSHVAAGSANVSTPGCLGRRGRSSRQAIRKVVAAPAGKTAAPLRPTTQRPQAGGAHWLLQPAVQRRCSGRKRSGCSGWKQLLRPVQRLRAGCSGQCYSREHRSGCSGPGPQCLPLPAVAAGSEPLQASPLVFPATHEQIAIAQMGDMLGFDVDKMARRPCAASCEAGAEPHMPFGCRLLP